MQLSSSSDGSDENDYSADLAKIHEHKRKFGNRAVYKLFGQEL